MINSTSHMGMGCQLSHFHLLTVAKSFIVSKLVPRVTHLLSFHQTKSTFHCDDTGGQMHLDRPFANFLLAC